MAGFLDLVSWVFDKTSPTEPETEVDEEAADRMAERASGEAVTLDVLTNQTERSDRPIVAYLEDDEQPEFVFRGMKLLISDENDSVARHYPTRETQVVITSRRFLFVIGGRLSDELWEVPLDDVVEVDIDVRRSTRYFVVEADREANPMTFMADISIESNVEDVESGVEFVASSTD